MRRCSWASRAAPIVRKLQYFDLLSERAWSLLSEYWRISDVEHHDKTDERDQWRETDHAENRCRAIEDALPSKVLSRRELPESVADIILNVRRFANDAPGGDAASEARERRRTFFAHGREKLVNSSNGGVMARANAVENAK